MFLLLAGFGASLLGVCDTPLLSTGFYFRNFVGVQMVHPQRKHNRLTGFDYSQNGMYFVTSCVQNRAYVFGTVTAGEMQLNQFGNLAAQQWHWLAAQYPYVHLHAFVVMPNHVHGIIEINR
ncbi:MAG: hypothetical protein LPJ89_04845, partial [Hymenobacteraceae bacterium]|nr:hypothetical protein [Hymenobacteraceae bacterium]